MELHKDSRVRLQFLNWHLNKASAMSNDTIMGIKLYFGQLDKILLKINQYLSQPIK